MRFKIIFLFLTLSFLAKAQQPFSLRITPVDKDTVFLNRLVSYKTNFSDTVARQKEVKKIMNTLYSRGYLFATADSVRRDSILENVFLTIGSEVKWAELSNGNIVQTLLDKIGFKEKIYPGRVFKASEVNSVKESILTYCENNGYPFAKVWLDSVTWNEENISAKIFLEKNKLILIDSVHLEGDAKISRAYLYNYIGVKPNSPYSESAIQKINSRLQELPFVEVQRAPTVIFNDNLATINLFLREKNASNFDLIIGVLPNNQTTGKLLLTGDGSLTLNNSLGKGELIGLRLNKFQNRTTSFKANLAYPFLLSLPFGIDLNFELFKNDTLYLDLKRDAGIQYLMKGKNYIKAFFRSSSSDLLSVDTNTVKLTHRLPPVLDISNNFYGLETYLEHLDYRLNPSKGWTVRFSVAAGERKIRKNSLITNLHDMITAFDFNSLYDTLDLKVNEYKFDAQLQKYFPFKQRNVFKLAYTGGLLSGKNLLRNELYRIGGNHLLRGFDEESIYASFYNVFTLEYHYLLGRNSYFSLFTDGAYWEYQPAGFPASAKVSDTPFGFGAGITFETKAGIFGLSYALGRQFSNPVELRSAKIHFGYVNLF